MRKFDSKLKDFGYLLYRLAEPVFDPIKFVNGLRGYGWFIKDLLKYKKMDPQTKLSISNICPQLHDKTNLTPFDAHYFYQQLWAFENVLKTKPKRHVDIGSTYEMSGYISKITKVEFVDIRPIETSLSNLKIVKGDITNLPYREGELESVSCLHVIEHIGLGRYRDPLDPKGAEKGMKELQRVMNKNGKLFFSTPVGKPRLCFNGHRIFDPEYILSVFDQLELVNFSVVNDEGKFVENTDITLAKKQNYACGMYLFEKRL